MCVCTYIIYVFCFPISPINIQLLLISCYNYTWLQTYPPILTAAIVYIYVMSPASLPPQTNVITCSPCIIELYTCHHGLISLPVILLPYILITGIHPHHSSVDSSFRWGALRIMRIVLYQYCILSCNLPVPQRTRWPSTSSAIHARITFPVIMQIGLVFPEFCLIELMLYTWGWHGLMSMERIFEIIYWLLMSQINQQIEFFFSLFKISLKVAPVYECAVNQDLNPRLL